ncbi:Secondary metabolism regulator LAE1 [Colletotrichum siamense]|uniref:Secondary metabolism regulator LAE1 n=1 Tax=Colletotrichum siamense TaxID=690259 RepID=UPI001872BB5A|nr:Secondary metabolism regulator LAE1 [Colletotrichum siamense]KAF5494145.1 Secondary metabolism regulator LAE1 [Colletotrichum siamense]
MCQNSLVNDGSVIAPGENDTDDTTSDLAVSVASSTTSVASSVLRFRIENGRTYHSYKEGKYSYPNDEKENERLDLQHNLMLLTLHEKLGLAPPNDQDFRVQRVLDVGTGTGLWAIDFADEHPDAEVLGTDLSPVHTTHVPPNAKFEIDDVEEPWTYSQPFDYIHVRGMTSSISDWKKFFGQCFANLEPGGYLELQEGHMRPECDDGTLTREHAISRWVDYLEQASAKFNRPFVDCPSLVKVVEEAGFVDVKLTKFKWPLNPWAKDNHYKLLGEWTEENFMEGIEAWTLAPLTRALEWTREEVLVFLTQVRKELRDRSIHAYLPIFVIHGRKPLQAGGEGEQ